MRLREFCLTQTADFALLRPFYDFINKKTDQVSVEDLLKYAVVRQEERIKDSHFHSFKQKIDEVFVEQFRCYGKEKSIFLLIDNYLSLLLPTISDQPYELFYDRKLQCSIKVLEMYGEQRLQQFSDMWIEKEEKERCKGCIDTLLAQARETKDRLPAHVISGDSGNHNEMEQEIEQKVEIVEEIEQKIDQLLQQEIEQYEVTDTGPETKVRSVVG